MELSKPGLLLGPGFFFSSGPTESVMRYNPRDAFYRKAKKEGYRSRAAYKLVELNRRFRIIRPGDLVLDLGAAPGGWMQIAAELVGPNGKVFGVDLQPLEGFKEGNVRFLQADIMAEEFQDRIGSWLQAPADCVLSDLAPRLSGIRDADASRAVNLNRSALSLAVRVLRPGGSFLAKSFSSDELENFVSDIKNYFRSVQRTRPEATRRGSSEIYVCAKGFRSSSPPP